MCITPNSEEAKCFEALVLLLKDQRKAWRLMNELNIDGSTSLPFYSNAIYASCGKNVDEISSCYKEIANAFDSEHIDFSIIPKISPLFPYNKSEEPVYYLYAAGNTELLKKKRVTCLGSPLPSLQGKSDMVKAVSEILALDHVVCAPLDNGLSSFALSYALKEGGGAIGILSGSLSKCPHSGLLELMGELYEKGLLLSQFPPSTKSEKWHVVLRNRFIAGISENVYLAEDKDGGPSWAIFDYARELGGTAILPKAFVDNPNYEWPKNRVAKGALVTKTSSDFRKLLSRNLNQGKRIEFDDLIPDLFS